MVSYQLEEEEEVEELEVVEEVEVEVVLTQTASISGLSTTERITR